MTENIFVQLPWDDWEVDNEEIERVASKFIACNLSTMAIDK